MHTPFLRKHVLLENRLKCHKARLPPATRASLLQSCSTLVMLLKICTLKMKKFVAKYENLMACLFMQCRKSLAWLSQLIFRTAYASSQKNFFSHLSQACCNESIIRKFNIHSDVAKLCFKDNFTVRIRSFSNLLDRFIGLFLLQK